MSSSDDCADLGSTLPTYLRTCRNNAETVHVIKHHSTTSNEEFRCVRTQNNLDFSARGTWQSTLRYNRLNTDVLANSYINTAKDVHRDAVLGIDQNVLLPK